MPRLYPLLLLALVACTTEPEPCDEPTCDDPICGDSEAPQDSSPPADSDPQPDTQPPVDTGPDFEGLEVYLLAGQSNMVGVGQVNGLPPSLQVAQDDVLLYRSAEPWWKDLEPASDYSASFGPEVTFGRTMADAMPQRRIALIKHAVGGTDLAAFWNPGDDPADPQRGEGYRVFIETVQGGLAALDASGEAWRIAGMIWMQGESDTFDDGYIRDYADNLERLIARSREDVSAPDMPFVVGVIDCSGCPEPGRSQVQQAQRDVAAASDTVFSLETTDLLGQPDGYHYTGVGMRVLGERFAQALLGAEHSAPPTPAVTLTGSYSAYYTGDFLTGWAFTTNRPITVSDLGLYDIGGDGLATTAEVVLWEESERSILARSSVPAAVSADTSWVEGFRYVGIEPVVLAPGDYVVAAQAFDGWDRYAHGAAIRTGDAVQWREGRHTSGSAVAFPTNVSAGDEGNAHWFGGSFLYGEGAGQAR
jgi:hypothetical protein